MRLLWIVQITVSTITSQNTQRGLWNAKRATEKSLIKGTRWNERGKKERKKESGNREKKIHKEFLTKLEVQTTI